jgi:hypothetical protein
MCVYTRVYVCMCVYVREFVCVRVCVCVCVCTHGNECISMYVCEYIRDEFNPLCTVVLATVCVLGIVCVQL